MILRIENVKIQYNDIYSKTSQKQQKTALAERMFDTNKTSARRYVGHIRP